MSNSILATELYLPPRRPNTISRHRLLCRLDNALHGKLTMVSAPAGFGKTTLVCEWLSSLSRHATWLSLDKHDNNPALFLSCLVAALRKVMPNIGEETLKFLQSPQLPPVESTLTSLINDIVSTAGQYILVLDDYHLVESSSVNSMVWYLVDNLPHNLHIVMITREDPSFPLARLRSLHELTELRAVDLRFTHIEITEFFSKVTNLNLSAENISMLESRTEGWIAGIRMAALSMADCGNCSEFLESFTGNHHFLMDYLVEEVLRQQDEYVSLFLLCTSILDKMCGPLCDVLLHPEYKGCGQFTLEYLQQVNLFIVPLDNERRWFRYHHLFAEFLHQRLKKNDCQPSNSAILSISELHNRASTWYEENGFVNESLHHAFSAGNYERVAFLLELAWPSMERMYQSGLWLEWVRKLPDDVIENRPVLNTAFAWALIKNNEIDTGEMYLRKAELLPESITDTNFKSEQNKQLRKPFN